MASTEEPENTGSLREPESSGKSNLVNAAALNDGPQEINYYDYAVIENDVVDRRGNSRRFDLATPTDAQFDIVNATAMILRTEGNSSHALFDARSERTLIPIYPHCHALEGQTHLAYDCNGSDMSFRQHASDYVLAHGIGRGTASFIGHDQVVTARHVIKTERHHLLNTYVMMNSGHGDRASWRMVDTDDDGVNDHLEIETKYLLAVKESPLRVSQGSKRQSDWIVLTVEPFATSEETIPPHSVFTPASELPPVGTEILVPSHPRLLPLKIADGHTAAPIPGETAMRAIFDVSGGSSGAPILLASDPSIILGVNRGGSFRENTSGGPREFTCAVSESGTTCRSQPITPSREFTE
ncbi:trypsin-like serine peptidase [Enhygromyxa salina]|uniref:trypsin-like serine peptidase n=1 Tax=Enhygromyxa salina TaxID=215803 RepID=UPI0011B1E321|nr:trypsin-like peptidase domain-containing protein [Enhygromyxa salina]